MSTIKVDTIRNYDSAVDFSQGFKLGGADVIQNYTESADVPETPTPVNGDYWWDTANNVLYRYMDGGFRALGITAGVVNYGDRAFSVGILNGGNSIDYWDMTTAGNAADFGDLVRNVSDAFCASSAEKIFVGSQANKIMIFTSSTLGNATDHCDMNSRTGASKGTGQTDGSVGLQAHGNDGTNSFSNPIDTFSTTTTSAATSFGVRTSSVDYLGSMANATRCVFGGGRTSGSGSASVNVMDYVTFSTAGNATDFGDLTRTAYAFGGAGSGEGSRGVWMGGYSSVASTGNTCDYITIDTAGNATDHGDLTGTRYVHGVCNNGTKGHASGGMKDGSGFDATIDEITLATTGNATDFGDLSRAAYQSQSASGSPS